MPRREFSVRSRLPDSRKSDRRAKSKLQVGPVPTFSFAVFLNYALYWQANITLNAEADSGYVGFVSQGIVELFGVPPRVMKRRNKNAIVVSLACTSIVEYPCKNGLIRGNKLRGGLSIPKWILVRKAYRMACVRGRNDFRTCIENGEMAEWSKAHAWKACVRETGPWVRIPLSPQ